MDSAGEETAGGVSHSGEEAGAVGVSCPEVPSTGEMDGTEWEGKV